MSDIIDLEDRPPDRNPEPEPDPEPVEKPSPPKKK